MKKHEEYLILNQHRWHSDYHATTLDAFECLNKLKTDVERDAWNQVQDYIESLEEELRSLRNDFNNILDRHKRLFNPAGA